MPSLAGLSALEQLRLQNNQFKGAMPAVPSPGALAAGGSRLCPNQFTGPASSAWDAATGVVPWYRDCAGASPRIPASERTALIDLYNATQGPNWTNHAHWLEPEGTECTWFGVVCNQSGTHVIGLSLGRNNLDGVLPETLRDLSQLAVFHAYENTLSGVLPALLGLSRLSDFRVNNNRLTGPIPAISGLGELVQFNVGNNALTGAIPSLSGLGKLEGFFSYNNQLTGQVPALTGLVKLRQFYVNSNQLSGAMPSLAGLSALEQLRLQNNQFKGAMPAVPSPGALAAGGSRLCPNQFTGPASSAWDAATGVVPWYRDCAGASPRIPASERSALIDLYNATQGPNWTNHAHWLEPEGTECTWFGVVCNPAKSRVIALRLADNGLRGAINGNLRNLAGLRELNLGKNALGGAVPMLAVSAAPDGSHGSVSAMGVAMVGMGNLRILDLHDNRFTGRVPDLTGMTQLEALRIGGNQFSGAMPAAPVPNPLRDGMSSLCPNVLDRVPNTDWDVATGQSPWYRACAATSVTGGFSPHIDAGVLAIAIQADGAMVVGGRFDMINGQSRAHLARLLPDGSLDPDFAPVAFDDDVYAIDLLSDGSILVGGRFTHVDGHPQAYLARLRTDGSRDTRFGLQLDGSVRVVINQDDGSVLLGGDFSHVGGDDHQGLARLTADGALDTSFVTQADGPVMALAVQADGRILLGGGFTHINGQVRSHLARVDSDGTLDGAFDVDSNGIVTAIVVQPDGGIVIGGGFNVLSGQARAYLARLSEDGVLDSSFDPSPNAAIGTILQQPDGQLLLAGEFTQIGGRSRAHLARVRLDGGVDEGFDPGASAVVAALALQSDERILIGGDFVALRGQAREHLARLHPDGGLDTELATSTNGPVDSLVLGGGGTLLVGGGFDQIGGQSRERFASIRLDGVIESGLLADFGANDRVRAVVKRADGSVLAAGQISRHNTLEAHNIVQICPGTCAYEFSASTDAPIEATVLQLDGKVVVAGSFTQVNGVPRAHVARLNSDGSLDTDFDVSIDGPVYTISALRDGSVLLGGSFHHIDGVSHPLLARLHPDGTLDSDFDSGFSANAQGEEVRVLVRHRDGGWIVGGHFARVSGQLHQSLVRVDVDGDVDAAFDPQISLGSAPGWVLALVLREDGRLFLAGAFDAIDDRARTDVARLDADGEVDPHWAIDVAGALQVNALALQTDGQLVMGGDFSEVGGAVRSNLARVATAESARYALSVSASSGTSGSVTWARGGSAPQLSQAPVLSLSVDGTHFSPIGEMSRVAGDWKRDDVDVPGNRNFWVRVRAALSSGMHNGSSGYVESTRLAYVRRDVLSVQNTAPATFAGVSGMKFEIVNSGPRAADQITLMIDADQADRLSFLPVCTTDTSTGSVRVLCENPADLGINCEQISTTERQCSIDRLSTGGKYSFFLAPAAGSSGPFILRILTNGVLLGQHAITP
jgi:uncharacterized delta-60 repeat protein